MNEGLPRIAIVFDGICKGCQNADLELERMECFGKKYWVVKCDHEWACIESWRKALSEAERRTDEAGRTD